MPSLDSVEEGCREKVVEALAAQAVLSLHNLHSQPEEADENAAITIFTADFYSSVYENDVVEESVATSVVEARVEQREALLALLRLYKAKAKLCAEYLVDCNRWIGEGWAPSPFAAMSAVFRAHAIDVFGKKGGPFGSLPVSVAFYQAYLAKQEHDDDASAAAEEEEEEEEEQDEGASTSTSGCASEEEEEDETDAEESDGSADDREPTHPKRVREEHSEWDEDEEISAPGHVVVA